MIAQLFEDVDSFEGLRVRAPEKGFNFRRRDEEPVQGELKRRETAEDDVFVFYGY